MDKILFTNQYSTRPEGKLIKKTVKTTGMNQRGTAVIEFKRTFMVWKRGHVPSAQPRG